MENISYIMPFGCLHTVVINYTEQLVLLLPQAEPRLRVGGQNILVYLEVDREGYFLQNLLTASGGTIVNHPLEMEDKNWR